MNLGEKLAALRKQKGLTQSELAEKINVSRQAISRWEVGLSVPSTDNLIFLSRLYDLPIDSLLQEQAQSSNAEPEKLPPDAETTCFFSRKGYLLLAMLCAAILITVGAVLARFLSRQEEKAPVPISKMDYTDEVQNTVATFNIYDIMEEDNGGTS